MSEWGQRPLFAVPAHKRCTHCYYWATDSLSAKNGQAKDPPKRVARMPGFALIWYEPCPCVLQLIDGRWYCERELRAGDLFESARLPRSERFRYTLGLGRWLRQLVAGDRRALALIDWWEDNGGALSA